MKGGGIVAKLTANERVSIIVDSVAVLIGEYNIYRKKAALLLLKAFLPTAFLKFFLSCEEAYPFERNDARVRAWTKAVLSKGRCEECGATEALEAHHIIKWAEYPAGRVDIRNGMCLCHVCHTNEHKEDQSYYLMKAKKCKGGGNHGNK